MKLFSIVFALVVLIMGSVSGGGEEADPKAVLASWFAAQANLKTWEADFVQTEFSNH